MSQPLKMYQSDMDIQLRTTKNLGAFDSLDIYMFSLTTQFQTLVCANQTDQLELPFSSPMPPK